MANIFTLTTDPDTFTGLAGDDNIFDFTSATLQSTDSITGGATGSFRDTLRITAAGSILASQLSGVTNVEELLLSSGGNNVTLTNGVVAGSSIGYFAVVDGVGDDTVDASAITNNIAVAFFASSGSDTFKGGNGNDAFVFGMADLTSADTVQSGAGIDNLYLSTAGTLAAGAFTNVTGIEGLVLTNGTNNVTLTDTFVAGTSIGYVAVAGGTGDDTVDASNVTNNTPIAFFSNGGSDTFQGGNGNDAVVIATADLPAATLAGGAGIDNLYLTTAGTVAAAGFANVTGFEGLVLSNGTNNITLTNGFVAGTSIGYVAVAGGTGDDTVDASAVTNNTPIAFYGTTGGNDTFTGGNANDAFLFAAGTLTSADTVVGGTASDTLWMTTAGTVNTGDTAGVSGIEGVLQQSGGTFNFANGLTGTGTLAAVGSSVVDTFNGAAVTGYALTMSGNGGADALTGGTGDDVFNIPDSAFASIDGNGGLDRIVLTGAGHNFNLTANAAKIFDTEIISLSLSSAATLTLAGGDIPLINSGTNLLYVVGEANDTVNFGSGFGLIATNHTNAAVAAGTFSQYQHTGGSTLYIQNTLPQAPVITSNGGGTTASISVNENATAVTTVAANDPNPSTTLIYSKIGGADQLLFNIDSGTGVLTFVTARNFEVPTDADTNNSYIVQVRASDGTLTDDQTITVNVQNVNETPLNAVPGGQSVNEDIALLFNAGNSNLISISDVDAGANPVRVTLTVLHGTLTLSGTAGLSFAGPGFGDGTADATMSFTGTVSAINTALNGLSYLGDLNYNNTQGAESLSIVTNDQGNTGSGGAQQDSDPITITVNPVNDAPVADDEVFNGTSSAASNTALLVDDPSDGPPPDPAGPQKTITGDILAGDTDVDTPLSSLTITAETVSNAGGSITFQADGDFTYLPAAGFSGNAVFSYTLNDNDGLGNQTDTGQITINVPTPKVWYVNASAGGGGDGTSDNPFNSLAALSTGGSADTLDGANDIIFLYGGTYTGGIVLEDGQQLISKSFGLTVSDGGAGNLVLEAAAAGNNALINGGVTLASGNTIQGIDFGNSGSSSVFALSGGAVGNAVVNTVASGTINNTSGGAVNISGSSGTGMNMVFTSVSSSNSSTNAISFNEARGTFSGGTGTLSNAGGNTVNITGNSSNDDLAFTYGGALSDDGNLLVNISGQTGGTKDFNGLLTDGAGAGGGISLTSNTGATIRFDGGMTLITTTSAGFSATGGGTVAVTDPAGTTANTIVTTTGTALNVASTTIHADGLTFQSIAANGAVNGIILNATGSNGLTVTGTDGGDAGTDPDAGTGGTIQNTTGDGVSLTSANNVSLGGMNNTNAGGHGINMSGGSNLTLTTVSVTGAGNGDNEHGMNLDNVSGTVSVQGSTFANAEENLIDIDNNNTNLTLNVGTVTPSTFTHGALVGDLGAFTGIGILVTGRGTSNLNINVEDSTFNNIKNFAIQVGGSGPGPTVWTGNNTNITLDNNDFLTTVVNALGNPNNRANTINIQGPGSVDIDASITNNVISGGGGGGIQLGADNSSNISANITGNTVSNQFADGILMGVDESASLTVLIDSNTITNTSSDGMEIANAISPDGLAATLNATITNNTVTNHNTNVGANAFFAGIGVFGGADAADVTFVNVTGNNVSGAGPGSFDYALDGSSFGDAITVQGSGTGAVAEADFLAAPPPQNISGSAAGQKTFIGNAFYSNGALVPLPVITPLLAADGQGPGGAASLTGDMLAPIVAEAVQRWIEAGVTSEQMAVLDDVHFTISDLADGVLAGTSSLNIAIDLDAAGWGWFVDATPADNLEFGTLHSATELAAAGGEAAAHIDLLTAMMHELGHALGLEHSQAPGDLMDDAIDLGIRRLPDAADSDHAHAALPPQGSTYALAQQAVLDAHASIAAFARLQALPVPDDLLHFSDPSPAELGPEALSYDLAGPCADWTGMDAGSNAAAAFPALDAYGLPLQEPAYWLV